MMVGFGEIAICLAFLVVFVGYAVMKSPAVRVLGWTLTAGAIARAFASENHLLILLVGLSALAVSAVGETRAGPRKKARP